MQSQIWNNGGNGSSDNSFLNFELKYFRTWDNRVPLRSWGEFVLVMGLCPKFWPKLGQPFMVWVEFGKFPLKMSNFSIFFPLDQKNVFLGWKVCGLKAGRPLIYCGAKVSSGRVMARTRPLSLAFSVSIKRYPLGHKPNPKSVFHISLDFYHLFKKCRKDLLQ